MTSLQIAELISMSLTPAAIWLSSFVAIVWAGTAIKALQTRKFKPEDWFAFGVAIGFTGAALDNAYWSIPWTLSYLDIPSSKWWFMNGVYPNIVSRQILGILAAYCHLRSYYEYSNSQTQFSRLLYWSIVICVVSAVVLFAALCCLRR